MQNFDAHSVQGEQGSKSLPPPVQEDGEAWEKANRILIASSSNLHNSSVIVGSVKKIDTTELITNKEVFLKRYKGGKLDILPIP